MPISCMIVKQFSLHITTLIFLPNFRNLCLQVTPDELNAQGGLSLQPQASNVTLGRIRPVKDKVLLEQENRTLSVPGF